MRGISKARGSYEAENLLYGKRNSVCNESQINRYLSPSVPMASKMVTPLWDREIPVPEKVIKYVDDNVFEREYALSSALLQREVDEK